MLKFCQASGKYVVTVVYVCTTVHIKYIVIVLCLIITSYTHNSTPPPPSVYTHIYTPIAVMYY